VDEACFSLACCESHTCQYGDADALRRPVMTAWPSTADNVCSSKPTTGEGDRNLPESTYAHNPVPPVKQFFLAFLLARQVSTEAAKHSFAIPDGFWAWHRLIPTKHLQVESFRQRSLQTTGELHQPEYKHPRLACMCTCNQHEDTDRASM